MIFLVLKKMRAPEKCVKWIDKSYGDFDVILKVIMEEVSIRCEFGFRHGDNFDRALCVVVI